MKRPAVIAVIVGLAAAATLVATNDTGAILAALEQAGWGVLLVVALHVPQTVLSGIAFGSLLDRRLGVFRLWWLRWIRESVNTLLPVAQVGGDVVRVRLLAKSGIPVRDLAAASIVDVSAEMVAQLAFTLFGVAVLLGGEHGGEALRVAALAAAATGGVAVAFLVAQRLGLARLIERLVARVTRGNAWSELGGDLAGLQDAALALYRRTARVAACGGWHLASWLAGIAETWAALHVLGLGGSLREATIIEALGQAIRAAGFLIPGALGVQEGGYLLICAMFGIAAPQALALSLVRRVREVALGVPGLALWQWLEARGRRARSEAA